MNYKFVTPEQYNSARFAADNHAEFLQFAELRIQGHHRQIAFKRVFAPYEDNDVQSHLKADAVEFNPYYEALYKKTLETTTIARLWNTKVSITETLNIVRSPFAKETAKLGAIKELNVLVGITVVDENGKTKAGASLENFYKTEGIEDVAARADAIPD